MVERRLKDVGKKSKCDQSGEAKKTGGETKSGMQEQVQVRGLEDEVVPSRP